MLGKYQLIAELARGGMGLVYLAVNSGLGGFSKLLVIKELKPELVEDQGFLEMFLEEARLAARLNHPNIVTTYEVGIDSDGGEAKRPYIVMDYLEGQTLARIIRKKSELFTLDMHVLIVAEALEGLHYAHTREDFDGSEMSVVHRDVSPQNVFVTYDGQIKVVDFGIAKASDTTVETRTGVFKGKPSYMAPEQLHGEVNPRSDVFSAGVMLWESLVGRRMWQKKSDVEILTSLLKGQVPSIDEHAPDAPEELRTIVKKALAMTVDTRYESAKALRDDLLAFLAKRDAKPTPKEVGLIVAKIFQEQRTTLRAIIEKCIAESKAGLPTRTKLPSIAPSQEEGSGPTPNESSRSPVAEAADGSSPSVPAATASSRPSRSGLTQRIDSGPIGIPGVPRIDSGSLKLGESGPHSMTPFSGATPAGAMIDNPVEDSQYKKRKGSPLFLYALAGGLVAAVVALILVLRLSSSSSSSSSSSNEAPPSATTEPSSSPTSTVTLANTAPTVPPSASVAASTAASASASASVAAKTGAPPPTQPPRYVHQPPAPPPRPPPAPPTKPTTTTPTVAPPIPTPTPASTKTDCNPPFYYEGTKKVFKPGCI